MKLFSHTFLFCFFVVLSLEFLDSILAAKFHRNGNASNDTGTLGGYLCKNLSSGAMLLSDEIHGKEHGDDVVLSGTGQINLTLTHEILVFEVCKSCMGTSTVCYEASRGSDVPRAVGDCRGPSSCEFKVNGEDLKIYFGEAPVLKERFNSPCSSTTMKYPFAHFLSYYDFESCEPKMDGNKMVKLYVDIIEGCSIKVKGAKIHVPATTSSPTKVPPPLSSQKDSAEASSFPDWGYAIIGIVGLIVIALIIGVIVYFLCKKRQASKRVSPNVDGRKPKSTASIADVAAETPTKKNDDLEAVKVVPTQMPKKDKKKPKTPELTTAEDVPENKKKTKTLEPETTEDVPENKKKTKTLEPETTEDVPENKKKTKTLEPKTTEDAPAPTVGKQEQPTPASKEPAPASKEPAPELKEPAPTSKEPAPKEPQPTPAPRAASYPQVKRLIPRGMKSAKSDSLDETLKKDKKAMVESFIVSAEKLCSKTVESDVFDEIKANYPNIQHEILAFEIKLLCVPVSQMYEDMNKLVHVSVNKLCAAGYIFDMDRQIVAVLKGAREFLKDPTTDATTVYFAFGAEYHHLVTDDPEIMNDASIPLLYVIALQPRFPEESRRKACAIMRRKLVKVLGYFKAADRAKMPFPVNIVEHAYCRDPKYFYDPSGIKTNSGSDGKKERMADAKRISDGKRKKKSKKH